MDIKPTYVTFEQAKKLKEKGWNQRTEMVHLFTPLKNILREIDINLSIVENELNAPEQWMVIEWLRVNYGIWVTIGYLGDGYNCTIQDKKGWTKKAMGNFNSPQEATSAAIDYVLENLIQ